MLCGGCSKWVHKKCSGRKRVTDDPNFRCARCLGTARPIDGRPFTEYQLGDDKLEVVPCFCYLGDMLGAAGGCDSATITRVGCAWKKFRELLPVLTSSSLSLRVRGHIYSVCVRSAMLHAAETWPLNTSDLHRLQRNDRAMIRWICKVKPEDTALVRSASLLNKLGLDGLEVVLREKRLRWFGHVQRAPGAIKSVTEMAVDGRRGRGRPKMTWKETTKPDREEWKLLHVDLLGKKARTAA